jgi:hypothetical protein
LNLLRMCDIHSTAVNSAAPDSAGRSPALRGGR